MQAVRFATLKSAYLGSKSGILAIGVNGDPALSSFQSWLLAAGISEPVAYIKTAAQVKGSGAGEVKLDGRGGEVGWPGEGGWGRWTDGWGGESGWGGTNGEISIPRWREWGDAGTCMRVPARNLPVSPQRGLAAWWRRQANHIHH